MYHLFVFLEMYTAKYQQPEKMKYLLMTRLSRTFFRMCGAFARMAPLWNISIVF